MTNQTNEEIIKSLEWRNDCTNESVRYKHHPVCQGCEKIVVLNEQEVEKLLTTTRLSTIQEVEGKIKKKLNIRCPEHDGHIYSCADNMVCCHGNKNNERHVLYRTATEAANGIRDSIVKQIEQVLASMKG